MITSSVLASLSSIASSSLSYMSVWNTIQNFSTKTAILFWSIIVLGILYVIGTAIAVTIMYPAYKLINKAIVATPEYDMESDQLISIKFYMTQQALVNDGLHINFESDPDDYILTNDGEQIDIQDWTPQKKQEVKERIESKMKADQQDTKDNSDKATGTPASNTTES